jgi:hypothetical protein
MTDLLYLGAAGAMALLTATLVALCEHLMDEKHGGRR